MLAPTTEEILEALREHGSLAATSRALGYGESWLKIKCKRDPKLAKAVAEIRLTKNYHGNDPEPELPRVSLKQEGDGLVLTFSTDNPKLGDIGQLIRECGLEPDEWTVVTCTLNRWEGMTAQQPDENGVMKNQKMPLNQWKVTLKQKAHLLLAMPATHVPAVAKKRRVVYGRDVPELIVVEGDHQVPYHEPALHQASLYALEEFHRKHNMTQHVFLGDTGDYPTISAHRDHPAAMAPVNEVIQGVYDVLRAKREAAPNAQCQILKGNHDWRLEAELLGRAERMYAIKPAEIDGVAELPALDLRRLLHLEKLRIELVEDERGWQHGEITLVEGIGGLVVRHGWLTSANSAEKTLKKKGRSIIVGHTHRPEHHFLWDPSAGLMRQAVTAGAMCKREPHFVPLDIWLQGFVTVTRWRDGTFAIEHAMWRDGVLRWRDRSWS